MKKIDMFKLAARVVVGAGTTTISNSIIKNNVSPANLPQTVSVAVASVVIGSMASEATKSHTERQIDAAVDAWKSIKSKDEDPNPVTVVTDQS